VEPNKNLSALVEVNRIRNGSTQSMFDRRVVVEATDLEYYSHSAAFVISFLFNTNT